MAQSIEALTFTKSDSVPNTTEHKLLMRRITFCLLTYRSRGNLILISFEWDPYAEANNETKL